MNWREIEIIFAWIFFYIYIGIGVFACGAIIYYWAIDVMKYINKIGH